jgi:hypothetical protein
MAFLLNVSTKKTEYTMKYLLLIKILLIQIFIVISPVLSSDAPILLSLTREDGKEKYRAFCRPIDHTSRNKIKCEFLGVRISYPLETSKNFSEMIQELKNESKTANEKDLLMAFNAGCETYQELINNAKKSENLPNPFIENIDDLKQGLVEICNLIPKGKEETIDANLRLFNLVGKWFAKIGTKCCGLTIQNWEMGFTRVSDNKWINSPEPAGMCNIVKVYELTFTDDIYWTMTETRVSADTESPNCKSTKNELMKPTRWLTPGPAFFQLPCEFITWSDVQFFF